MPFPAPLTRRQFLRIGAAAISSGALVSCRSPGGPSSASAPAVNRLFFVMDGKTVLINADGTGRRVLELDVPQQATWQPAGFFPDGRILLLSMEPRRDGPGRSFEEYYTQTPTHLWIYDLDSGSLEEIATKNRLAVFYTPQLILPEGRLLVQVVRNQVGQVINMNLDGSDPREFTQAGEGLPYGFSLSPNGQRVAFHLAGPRGYEIWTSNEFGAERQRIAGDPAHLYFGPQWSPQGDWLAYQDCHYRDDPGHDWCDVQLSRPDGSETRALTEGQSMWFGATYGHPQQRGGGSNVVAWTQDGAVLFPWREPGSKVAWEFQPQRPDTDHFNRDYRPDRARGGTRICRLHPAKDQPEFLTPNESGTWDFRCSESGDGRQIVFCRARTGTTPSLWILEAKGTEPRALTPVTPAGADHPRWLPSAPA